MEPSPSQKPRTAMPKYVVRHNKVKDGVVYWRIRSCASHTQVCQVSSKTCGSVDVAKCIAQQLCSTANDNWRTTANLGTLKAMLMAQKRQLLQAATQREAISVSESDSD